MHCRNCANVVDDRAVACPKCGVPPRAGTSFCQSCGQATQPQAVVCTSCGVALASASSSDKKVMAGVFGIILGAFGIHKFIIGATTAGVIMVLVSVLTCGWGAIPMGLIGLIEGIIYLTKTDEEFERIYVQGKKGWF